MLLLSRALAVLTLSRLDMFVWGSTSSAVVECSTCIINGSLCSLAVLYNYVLVGNLYLGANRHKLKLALTGKPHLHVNQIL